MIYKKTIKNPTEEFQQVILNYSNYLKEQLKIKLPNLEFTIKVKMNETKSVIKVKNINTTWHHHFRFFRKIAEINFNLTHGNNIVINFNIEKNKDYTQTIEDIVKDDCFDYIIQNYLKEFTLSMG